MFERVYASTYHHPLVMWAVGAVVLAALIARLSKRGASGDRRFLGIALILFQLEILLDAWLTSPLTPSFVVGPVATAVAVTFVILGDFRFFVLLERFGHPKRVDRTPMRWLALPLAYALVVPIASNVARFVWPGNFRALFLTYELMFAVLAIVVRVVVLPRRPNDAVTNTFVTALTHYEIAQYVAWASADIVILLGYDVGYALRLVPNLMYYVGFVPFVWKVAPQELSP